MPEPTAAALGRALAWRVFVDSDGLSLGEFMTKLAEYGEACVREGQADAIRALPVPACPLEAPPA